MPPRPVRSSWRATTRSALKQGQRTAAHLNAARAVTFAKAGAQYIDAHRSGWSAKSTQAWTSSFDQHVYPVIGALPVQEIDTSLVMRVIEPIWTTKTETASRVRGRIEAVMDWAATRGFRKGDNPARWDGHLENLLPAKTKVAKVEHLDAMPYAALPEFMARLRRGCGNGGSSPRVHNPHCGEKRRGAQGRLERDRSRGQGLDGACGAHEGGRRA